MWVVFGDRLLLDKDLEKRLGEKASTDKRYCGFMPEKGPTYSIIVLWQQLLMKNDGIVLCIYGHGEGVR